MLIDKMQNEQYKKVEVIFQNSTSQDELFDAFGDALKNNLRDFDLYKILLANPVLSADEVKMYAEKLLKEFPINSYHILLWVAKIFESQSFNFTYLDDSIHYFERAINTRPTEHEPHLSLLNIYNYEVEVALNKKILSLVEAGINRVIIKSKVYYALADLYKRMCDTRTASKYLALAEKSTEYERE